MHAFLNPRVTIVVKCIDTTEKNLINSEPVSINHNYYLEIFENILNFKF